MTTRAASLEPTNRWVNALRQWSARCAEVALVGRRALTVSEVEPLHAACRDFPRRKLDFEVEGVRHPLQQTMGRFDRVRLCTHGREERARREHDADDRRWLGQRL